MVESTKNLHKRRKLPEGLFFLDGATGTELDKRGKDCSMENSLWSTNALISSPDAVKEVHRNYLQAGA